MRVRALRHRESPLWALVVRVRTGEAGLTGSLTSRQLLSADLDERRHARWIDAEALSNEVLVGTQSLQTKSDPIGPREVVEVRRFHHTKVPNTEEGSLSISY